MNMSYDSSNLTTPDIKWLGVRPSDLNRFNIPQQCRLAMTDEDIKMGKKLVSTHMSGISGVPVLESLQDVQLAWQAYTPAEFACDTNSLPPGSSCSDSSTGRPKNALLHVTASHVACNISLKLRDL